MPAKAKTSSRPRRVGSRSKKSLASGRKRSKAAVKGVGNQKAASGRKPSFCLCHYFSDFCTGIYGALKRKRRKGFSMIEVLVVVALVSIFTTAGAVTYQSSQVKARDAARKGDLQSVRTAFEDYYNDFLCYPPAAAMTDCGSATLSPYLKEVPCDPHTSEPYYYVPLENCRGYRLLATLENQNDPVIAEVGCGGEEGCGYGPNHNFGVAAGVAVYDPTGPGVAEPGPTPTPPAGSPPPGGGATPAPTSTPDPGQPIYVYACDSGGVCNRFEEGHPSLNDCPATWEQANCNNECNIVALRCSV